MFKLYTDAAMGGFAPHAVLEEADADYQLIRVDLPAGEARSDAFRKLNPRAEVPVLELPDGSVMTESSAMVIYLSDLLAPGVLAPAIDHPRRPHYLRWISFMVANVYASDRRYYYADRHTDDPDGIEAVKSSALRDMEQQLAIIDNAIGDAPFLLGDTFSSADIYLTMLAHWHPIRDAFFPRIPNVHRLCMTVRDREALQRINAFHKLW